MIVNGVKIRHGQRQWQFDDTCFARQVGGLIWFDLDVYPALIIASKLCALVETAAVLQTPFVKQRMGSKGCVGFVSGGIVLVY
jgi:hypothetical protein